MEQQTQAAAPESGVKTFNSLEDLMADDKFRHFAHARILRIHKQRAEVLKTSKAPRLKSSPFSRLDKEGKMNVDFLRSEFPKIDNGTSTLSAGERQLVAAITQNALIETMTYYEQNGMIGGSHE